MIARIITKWNFSLPNLLKDNNFNKKGYNPYRYFSKHCLQNLLIQKFFYPESAAFLLDDGSFYYKSMPLLSILISSKQQFKPKYIIQKIQQQNIF